MKLLVVSLALSIFTGSQAFVLRDEASPKMDELQRQVSYYAYNLIDALLFRPFAMTTRSEIGQALKSWIEDRVTKLEQQCKVLKDAFPPEVIEVGNQASSAYYDLERKVIYDLRIIRHKMATETEAFYEALMSDVNPILEKLDPYTEPLRQTLAKTYAEMKEKLTELLKWQLEQLQPHAKEIRLQVQEGRDPLEPIAGRVQKYLVEEIEKAYNVSQQSAARILGVFEKHREGFDQWVRAPLFPEDH